MAEASKKTGAASTPTQKRPGSTATARPGRKRGSVNKEVIMGVASTMFRERGYDRTSLDDIAAGLSITKPSLYYHFASKEEILLECIARGYILFQQKIADRDDIRLPGRERVRIFIECYVDLLQDNVLSMIVADERVMSDAGKAKSRNYKRMLNRDLLDRLEVGRKDGSLAFDDARIISFGIFGMVNWMTHWQSAALLIEPRTVSNQFVAMILDGIGKP
ncbi:MULTISPECIES: TetR/AcrR family transcriptional regulator [Sphingopyxis]|uniref:TetR/AcrR family transcriptional regulator n=1 Tax=Sphingopyxis TaxID=165697 RepID=UPI001646AAA7|nr:MULTISPECIES: TetR/AcrR family transcriptional regulator [Sphingopyxis]QXF11333.1 TetR/AcrR family transcriptional regulator [Sphingopyxis terrae subsp. terrae]